MSQPPPQSNSRYLLRRCSRSMRRQALIMGYSDAFALLGVTLILAACVILLTRKGQASGAGAH